MARLDFALNLPPKKAIEWLEQKGVTDRNYREMTPSELAKVMTVSRITDLDMLQTIKDEMVKSLKNGTTFNDFKKNLLNHMQKTGWIHKDSEKKTEIIDPKSGEVFGTPRRLETLYRTNMQSAFSAAQYQTYMENIDNRPYWEYSAVNDSRTRPSHSAMSGLVYRYDDPFWATFYPPNGYNCRCSVIALGERDIVRNNRIVNKSGESNFIETDKIINKKGDTFQTMAFKTPTGQLITTDKGFDYNAGRMNYRPDLDQYDRGLAQAFAKADMSGAEFKASLKQLETEFETVKKRMALDEKIKPNEKITIRNTLSRNLKFAAGVLSESNQQLMGIKRATVWLSDDTLIKQVESRKGQNFNQYYDALPDVINEPDLILTKSDNFNLIKKIDGSKYLQAIMKYVPQKNELFLQSYYLISGQEKDRLEKKMSKLK